MVFSYQMSFHLHWKMWFSLSDTSGFHLTSEWAQIMIAPILVFALALMLQLYAITGFILLNFTNYGMLQLRNRLKKYTASAKYDVLAIATVAFIIYVLICGYVSSLYAGEHTTYRESVYRWIMLLLSIADENLLDELWKSEDDSKGIVTVIFAIITMILIGFHFSALLFASFVNCLYRLTYKLNAQTKHKKGALQGWWVWTRKLS